MKLLTLILAFQFGAAAAFLSPASTSTRSHLVSNMAGTEESVAKNEISRRGVFGSIAASSLLLQGALAASAADVAKLVTYEDTDCGFQISVPSNWDVSEQTLPDRRKMKLYMDPSSDKKTLLFLAYTPVRDDFTQLSSFGTVDQVAQMTILPKGELAGEENSSKMISAESKKNAYMFDYTAKILDQPKTHYRTIFALASNVKGAAGSVLVTITAQTPESNYENLKGVFDDIIGSYGKIGSK